MFSLAFHERASYGSGWEGARLFPLTSFDSGPLQDTREKDSSMCFDGYGEEFFAMDALMAELCLSEDLAARVKMKI